MRSRIFLAALGALLFLTFAVVLWPARVAVSWLVPDGATLTGVTGTVWDGAAAGVRIGIMDVGSLRWEARPLSFLALRPTWRLEARRPDGFARATVEIRSAADIRVSGLELATTLDAVANWINVAGTRGNLSASIDELALSSGRIAVISGWVNLDSVQPLGLRDVDLGTFRVDVPAGQEAPFSGTVAAVSGPLVMENARIEVQPNGQFVIEGLVAAKADAPEMIVQGLQFLGPADARGFRPFRQQGDL